MERSTFKVDRRGLSSIEPRRAGRHLHREAAAVEPKLDRYKISG